MKSISEFLKAYGRVTYWWAPLDDPLRQICVSYPDHEDQHVVFAKVALVNRVYRTNVEKAGAQAEWRLAKALVAGKTDAVLAPLGAYSRFDEASLPSVVKAHHQLVAIAKRVTMRAEVSFCSKYLSFHFPEVVPILDLRAEATAKRLLPDHPPRGIARFEAHCIRVLELMKLLRESGVAKPDLKLVDHVLYDPDMVEGQA